MALRLVLVDDHRLFRESLKSLLQGQGFTIVGEAGNGLEALDLVTAQRPDVVVMDLMMPGGDGLDATRKMRELRPETAIVLLTAHADEMHVMDALRAGVSGYVLKSMAASNLVEAIHEVHRGQMYLSPGISRSVVNAMLRPGDIPLDPLTPREREVVRLIAEGKTTKEVATTLKISTKTAESYRAKAMEKLKVHDVAGLVRYAVRRGMIEP
jgi:DNA-binding NarL/FixJ family response regulator